MNNDVHLESLHNYDTDIYTIIYFSIYLGIKCKEQKEKDSLNKYHCALFMWQSFIAVGYHGLNMDTLMKLC